MTVDKEETALWEGLTQKDENAFKEVYTTYYQALYRYGRKITHDDDVVKDAIQELFLSLYHRETPFNQQQPIKFFLLTALRNKLMDSLNKSTKNISSAFSDDEVSDSTHSSLDQIIAIELQHEVSEKLQRAMSQLSERQREALHLRYFEDLSPTEIADIMAMNYQSVLNLMQRGLNRLSGLIRIIAVLTSVVFYMLIVPIPHQFITRIFSRR